MQHTFISSKLIIRAQVVGFVLLFTTKYGFYCFRTLPHIVEYIYTDYPVEDPDQIGKPGKPPLVTYRLNLYSLDLFLSLFFVT